MEQIAVRTQRPATKPAIKASQPKFSILEEIKVAKGYTTVSLAGLADHGCGALAAIRPTLILAAVDVETPRPASMRFCLTARFCLDTLLYPVLGMHE
ncbi:hypothetical protein EYD00_25760 (plasmid) [Agrobacterium sp. 33MFTa1.1]|uniref:hypothetical protein n=1 Tax=Agrobacterium sp. 33MFTa1.1 TaxID=1279031 RepID=UPI00103AF14D|nr:hypothetical protein [Agrobacterium sp. 33MFTa1.1]QBJ16833.1 hypothetical protein EYD00_25760 [Agrobacterium sp. 33MFTa1.1]